MDKHKIVVALVTDQNEYQLEQAAAAQSAALKLGLSVEIVYAGGDAVQQTQQLLKFIQEPDKRPHAILVEPVGTGMPAIARAAVTAGIGWGVMNASVDYVHELRQLSHAPVFNILPDQEAVGKIQGQQIGALLGDKGCVLYIEGPAVLHTVRVRANGMLSTKPAGVEVKSLKGDWTQGSGHRAVKSWLSLSTSRQLHVSLIAAQNDDMALGARHAFEEVTDKQQRDAWLALAFLGIDGVRRSGQTWVRQGQLTATVVVPPIAGEAVQMVEAALRSGAQPAESTLIAPTSFPALSALPAARAAKATK
jgi:ribose transport system substrate-binding protein